MSLSLRKHKRRAAAGLARRIAHAATFLAPGLWEPLVAWRWSRSGWQAWVFYRSRVPAQESTFPDQVTFKAQA